MLVDYSMQPAYYKYACFMVYYTSVFLAYLLSIFFIMRHQAYIVLLPIGWQQPHKSIGFGYSLFGISIQDLLSIVCAYR